MAARKKSTSSSQTDRATGYCKDVVAGKIIACRYTRLACERHLSDLKRKDIRWDVSKSEKAIDFFRMLKHYKGGHSGEVFFLEPWQCFIVGSAYGWRMLDGSRRYRYLYVEVPRKNGKTTMGAGFGIRELLIEHGAEVYSVATKEDQAKIGWRDGKTMIQNSPYLSGMLQRRVKEIRHEAKEGIWRPLGSDSDTLDGLNPSFAFMDELHQWKTRDLWDVIDDGMGSRTNPLILEITTAGHNQNGICYEHRKHVINILEGKDGYTDDRFFGVIYTVDDPDKWEDEREWRKANPNLDVSKGLDWMRDQAKQARQMTTKLNAFLNKQLNIWTQQEHCWLSLDKWDACLGQIDDEDLFGVPCVGGLDLSSTLDITALSLYWPSLCYSVSWFWSPEETAIRKQRDDRVPYLDWERQGYLELTPGDVVDYQYIRSCLKRLKERYAIERISYDRWNSSQIVKDLESDGFKMEKFGQGFASMSAPSKQLEMMIASGRFKHNGNPVMRWMVGNVSVDTDPAGNIKPKKPDNKKAEKVDGVVSTVMAIGGDLQAPARKKSGFLIL